MLVRWLAAGILGLVAAPALTRRGMEQLDRAAYFSVVARMFASVVGASAAAVAVTAADRTRSWWWLPCLFAWAVILVAAAQCDAQAQRIPTPLVRTGGVVVLVLACVAGLGAHDAQGLALTVIASVAAGSMVATCWRFAGVGFGDVRIAAFGGLGLGHATLRGLALALGGFVVLLTAQALWTFARTRNRHATFACGPALALGFLIAAAA